MRANASRFVIWAAVSAESMIASTNSWKSKLPEPSTSMYLTERKYENACMQKQKVRKEELATIHRPEANKIALIGYFFLDLALGKKNDATEH